MQITYLGGKKFEIKTPQAKVIFDGTLDIENFLIKNPGEYERKGVFVEGIKSNSNTIFVVHAEGISLCYTGSLTHLIIDEVIKQIGDIDILFIPLGEESSISVAQAGELIAKIDPRIVIPMLYSELSEFIKQEGISDEEIESLKIKRAELPEGERKFFLLKAK